MSRTRRVTIVGGFCAAMVAAQAVAAPLFPNGNLNSRTVRYSNDELGNVAGARGVAARITYAADYVCGGENLLLRSTTRFLRCREDAAARAASDLQAPLVTAALGTRYTRVGLG